MGAKFSVHNIYVGGGQGSKVVNKENKIISKEGNFTERTDLTSKEFKMLSLAKVPRAPT